MDSTQIVAALQYGAIIFGQKACENLASELTKNAYEACKEKIKYLFGATGSHAIAMIEEDPQSIEAVKSLTNVVSNVQPLNQEELKQTFAAFLQALKEDANAQAIENILGISIVVEAGRDATVENVEATGKSITIHSKANRDAKISQILHKKESDEGN